MTQLHENLARQDSLEARRGSERSFGLVFAIVFGLLGLYPLIRGDAPHWWLVAAGIATAAAGLFAPALLRHPNRWWFKLGELLARIVAPLAIGVVYYVSVVPIGLLMRILGKDPLRLRRDAEAASYWIPRAPPGPEPKSLGNQF
jgi:hypothetical protein